MVAGSAAVADAVAGGSTSVVDPPVDLSVDVSVDVSDDGVDREVAVSEVELDVCVEADVEVALPGGEIEVEIEVDVVVTGRLVADVSTASDRTMNRSAPPSAASSVPGEEQPTTTDNRPATTNSGARGRDGGNPSCCAQNLGTLGTMAANVLGTELQPCSLDPLTGFYRDGCCNTGGDDAGVHVVCALMTDAFLAFSARQGNDLSTPQPAFGFAGLKAGDQWCLCASRWKEALDHGMAPPVFLAGTHMAALEYATLDELKAHAIDGAVTFDPPDEDEGDDEDTDTDLDSDTDATAEGGSDPDGSGPAGREPS